jgi:hypothetical protein
MKIIYKYLKAMTLMTNLHLQLVLTMKWLIVMMRLMIRLTPHNRNPKNSRRLE